MINSGNVFNRSSVNWTSNSSSTNSTRLRKISICCGSIFANWIITLIPLYITARLFNKSDRRFRLFHSSPWIKYPFCLVYFKASSCCQSAWSTSFKSLSTVFRLTFRSSMKWFKDRYSSLLSNINSIMPTRSLPENT